MQRCQHIAGREQTGHERRGKTICICFMLILEELVSFDVKQNTHNYLSLLHTHPHTHWMLNLSLFMRTNVNFYECESG